LYAGKSGGFSFVHWENSQAEHHAIEQTWLQNGYIKYITAKIIRNMLIIIECSFYFGEFRHGA